MGLQGLEKPAEWLKVIGLPSERHGRCRLCSRGSSFTSKLAVGLTTAPPHPPDFFSVTSYSLTGVCLISVSTGMKCFVERSLLSCNPIIIVTVVARFVLKLLSLSLSIIVVSLLQAY